MADDSPVESYFIDRFGPVLVTVVVTIAMLLVVNLPRRGSATSIAEVAVTVLTGMTLLLALLAVPFRRGQLSRWSQGDLHHVFGEAAVGADEQGKL